MSALVLHQSDDEVVAIGPILDPDGSYYVPAVGDTTTLVIKPGQLSADADGTTYPGTFVEDDGAAGQWHATFTVPKEDLPTLATLWYRVRVIDGDGNQQTIVAGRVEVNPGTKAQRASATTAPVLNMGASPALTAHIVDAVDAHDASAISVTPFGTIAATDVQAALVEVLAEATGVAHPDLAAHDTLGLATQVELDALSAALPATYVPQAVAGRDIGLDLDPARIEGTTDDTLALAAAIAALPAAGGTILLGTRHLHLFTMLDITKPARFVTAGRALGVIESHATKLMRCSADNVLFEGVWLKGTGTLGDKVFDNTKTVAGNHKGWRFHRCKVTGASLSFTAIGRPNADGTFVATGSDHASDVQVVDCEITDSLASYAVEAGGIDGFVFEKSHLHNTGVDATVGEGLKVLAGTKNFRVVNNHIHDNTRDGIDVYTSFSGVIANNSIHDNGVWGIEAKWQSIDSPALVTERFVIADNEVRGNASGGINAATSRTIVTGNLATGNGASGGIRFSSSTDALADSFETVIANNVATDNTGDGLSLTGGTRVIVSGNHAHRNANGITLGPTATAFTVVGNQATSNTTRGISISGTGHVVESNLSQDGSAGYFMQTGATLVPRDSMGWGFPMTCEPNLATSSASFSANTTRFYRVKGAGTITKVGFEVVVQSGNICLSVYSPTGVGRAAKPGARRATSGSVACPASGYAEVALGASVVVNPGDFIGISVDNITASFRTAGGTPTVTALSDGAAWAGGGFPPADPAPVVTSISGRLVILVGVA